MVVSPFTCSCCVKPPNLATRLIGSGSHTTDLEQGRREQALIEQVLLPLTVNYAGVLCELDSTRETGRGYYVGACFHVYATNVAGTEFELIDGGFTTWTQQVLSNTKERLLVSGLGTERLCSQFTTPPARAD